MSRLPGPLFHAFLAHRDLAPVLSSHRFSEGEGNARRLYIHPHYTGGLSEVPWQDVHMLTEAVRVGGRLDTEETLGPKAFRARRRAMRDTARRCRVKDAGEDVLLPSNALSDPIETARGRDADALYVHVRDDPDLDRPVPLTPPWVFEYDRAHAFPRRGTRR